MIDSLAPPDVEVNDLWPGLQRHSECATPSLVDPEKLDLHVDPTVTRGARPDGGVDFAAIRSQVTIRQVLHRLGHLDRLQVIDSEHRGPCPVPTLGPSPQSRS